MIDPRAPNIEDPGPELPAPHLVPFVLGERPRDSSPNVVFVSINMCLDRHWRDPMVGIGAPGLVDEESKFYSYDTGISSSKGTSYPGIEAYHCLDA